jgi:hypothetical protein
VPPKAASIRMAVRDKLNNRTGTYEVQLPLKGRDDVKQVSKKVD